MPVQVTRFPEEVETALSTYAATYSLRVETRQQWNGKNGGSAGYRVIGVNTRNGKTERHKWERWRNEDKIVHEWCWER